MSEKFGGKTAEFINIKNRHLIARILVEDFLLEMASEFPKYPHDSLYVYDIVSYANECELWFKKWFGEK